MYSHNTAFCEKRVDRKWRQWQNLYNIAYSMYFARGGRRFIYANVKKADQQIYV